MTQTLPATKVRKQFFKLLAATEQPGSSITITVGGEPKVVMMSVADFEGWQETLEIMADKKLMKDIKNALETPKREKVYTERQIKRELHLP